MCMVNIQACILQVGGSIFWLVFCRWEGQYSDLYFACGRVNILACILQVGGSLFWLVFCRWEGQYSGLYFAGGMGGVWSIFWLVFSHDSPVTHPRMSKKEKRYIIEVLNGETDFIPKAVRIYNVSHNPLY